MNNLSATYKGLITGFLMLLVSIGIFYTKGNFESNLQYITYALYVGGIIWTLNHFHKSNAGNKSFKDYFTEGFKCFIVITFLMVLFTLLFTKLNPQMKEQMGVNYRADLVGKGNYTAPEIDTMVQKAKDYFTIMLTSMAIFGYLIIGSMVTLITTLFFIKRKPVQ
jgi:hypothetical protein